jgi:DNA-binding PadR family transcriptional regulator
MDKTDQISNLTLLLIYLTSWEEKEFDVTIHRAWKGYDFTILDELEEKGFITKSKTAKSVYLTEEGLKAAMQLQEKLSMI